MKRQRWMLGAAAAVVAAAFATFFMLPPPEESADPENSAQVAHGRAVYAARCASCHGEQLEGQPNWRGRQPNGRLPAPPHDATGHTWHHADKVLFELTKHGLAAHAPSGYQSDMPAFAETLRDEDIWAVLAYIKASWPQDIRDRQRRLTDQSR